MPSVVIPRGEAFEAEWKILRKDRYTGTPAPIDEDSAVLWWLSLTFKGEPVTPASVVTLTRRALELRSDGRELWFGILAADDVTDALAGVATGDSIHEVLSVDGERKDREIEVSD